MTEVKPEKVTKVYAKNIPYCIAGCGRQGHYSAGKCIYCRKTECKYCKALFSPKIAGTKVCGICRDRRNRVTGVLE